MDRDIEQPAAATLAPMLGVPKVDDALAWYAQVFGARRIEPYLTLPDGTVAHAEAAIGDGVVMLADHAAGGAPAPGKPEAATARISLQVSDVDAVFARARAAGAQVLIEPADQFYGHRAGRLQDPFGHVWVIGQQIETVAPDEMRRRLRDLAG